MTYVYKSATSNSVFIELVDSTTGLPKTGIVHTDVTGSYVRTRSARVAITMATLASASAAYSSGGFILIDDTNQPGVYRIDVPDAAFLTGAVAVVVTVKATGCRTVSRLFSLVDINNQVAYAPNVAAGGIGGLLTAPTTANTGLANVTQFGGTALTAAAGVPEVKVASIAANAVNASALASDAVAEIQSGLATQTSVDDLPTNAELSTALGTADDAVLAAIATVQSDTNDIQTRLPAALESGRIAAALDSAATAALVDLIWDEPLTGATHNVATSSGKRLRQTTAFQQIDSTVIDAAATTTTFVTGLTSSVDNFYNDSMLVFTDGALAGQVRAIYDYIGATKTIILEEALTSAPVNGVAFTIVSLHIHPVSQIQSGLATSAALATESTKLNRIEAVATGTVTGAGTSTEVFVGPSATLTITVDSSGNRSAVVVT